jgi:adenylate kinase
MFRAAVQSGTDFGQRLREYMESGELVPDDVTIGVVAARLEQDDTTTRGFILDGFPRNAHQADELSKILIPRDIDLALDLEVDTEVVLKRLAARRVCKTCGANYSTSNPPKYDWTCDACGGEVVQRPDDTEIAIRRRLELYEVETAPLIQWYLERDKLVQINGLGSPDTVTARVIRAIDHRRDRGH